MYSEGVLLRTEPEGRELPKKERMSGSVLFWIFLAGSVAGFFLEGVWCVLRKGVWESHSATLWGPFCVIYGAGAVALALVAPWLRGRSLPGQFALCAGAGTLVELAGSLLQEKVFGTASWDYSRHPLNLGGRISLEMTALWGTLGLCFVHLVLPSLRRLLAGPEPRFRRSVRLVLTMLLAADLLLSAAALLRWRERACGGGGADNALARYLDRAWDDGRMERRYPSVRFAETGLLQTGEGAGLSRRHENSGAPEQERAASSQSSPSVSQRGSSAMLKDWKAAFFTGLSWKKSAASRSRV